jgi:hypothetical protein
LERSGKRTGRQAASPDIGPHDGRFHPHSWSTVCNASSIDPKESIYNGSEDNEPDSVPKVIEAQMSDPLEAIGAWVTAGPLDADYKSGTTQIEANSVPFGLRSDPRYPQEIFIEEPTMQKRIVDNIGALSTSSTSHGLQGTAKKKEETFRAPVSTVCLASFSSNRYLS